MIEVLKQALEALTINSDRVTEIGKQREAIASLRQAIAELESQEPRNVRERWNVEFDGNDLLVCFNDHEKGDKCQYERYSPQRTEERNFCPRCGKRTADLTVIHTCTPPQNIEQDLSEQGRKKSAILGNNIEEMTNNGLPFLTALDTALKVYDHHTPRLHQPQRTWVGLTNKEVFEICYSNYYRDSQLVKMVEAKLKERNG